MNQITSFRLCTLSNDELLKKVDSLTDEMYKTGKIHTRHIPARPDSDYDLLIGELILRFSESQSELQSLRDRVKELEEYQQWLDKKIEQCLEDKSLGREHWAFCQASKKFRELTQTEKNETNHS